MGCVKSRMEISTGMHLFHFHDFCPEEIFRILGVMVNNPKFPRTSLHWGRIPLPPAWGEPPSLKSCICARLANGCYLSWVCGQIFFCFKRQANKAKGSIQCWIDPFTLFVCQTADNSDNSYSYHVLISKFCVNLEYFANDPHSSQFKSTGQIVSQCCRLFFSTCKPVNLQGALIQPKEFFAVMEVAFSPTSPLAANRR